MNGLMLHVGAKPIEYAALRELALPPATETHVPIAHHRVVDLVAHALGYFGHEIVSQDFGVTEDSNRFFGVMTLKSNYGDYTDVCGLRNSHDRRFPISVGFGSRVFVCDNMAFVTDIGIKRKHTKKAAFELPGLIGEIIEPLALRREELARKIITYKAAALTEADADHGIMTMFREGVIGVQRIAEVEQAYREPPHDWGSPSAWRLFNAATFALTGKVMDQPELTPKLHKIIDGVCEQLH